MRVNEVTRPEFTIDSEKGDGPIGHSLVTWFSHGEETMCQTTKPTEEPRNSRVGEGGETAAHGRNKVAEKKESERVV